MCVWVVNREQNCEKKKCEKIYIIEWWRVKSLYVNERKRKKGVIKQLLAK